MSALLAREEQQLKEEEEKEEGRRKGKKKEKKKRGRVNCVPERKLQSTTVSTASVRARSSKKKC